MLDGSRARQAVDDRAGGDLIAGAVADKWYRLNGEAFAKAEALGWRPDDGQVR
ncbi:hypothetical protein [Rhizobium sp. WYCCWR10014]|uniref:hypothetical protein n=1 Tax=Rhizobium sp. WYCCWR10014 TaxID=1825933 RepID=UPI0012E7EBFD|nr:hypothetical protein [Rhizobium sp. WYCCWR10014]